MIERTPILNLATHLILAFGLILILVPIWLAFVAATHDLQAVNSAPVEFRPGDQLWLNLKEAWVQSDFGQKFVNSFIVAIGVVVGNVTLACITAYALVFFQFRDRMVILWAIFIILMLPLEVRIVPTFAVAANALSPFQTIMEWTGTSWLVNSLSGIEVALEWNLLNSYTGLILPLVATTTGTFLYRQLFLTIPDELVEAARMDGAGPLRFLWDILIPLSKTNIGALATIVFVYAWNQYLWPLLVVTDRANYGQVVNQLEPRERGCAMVFQNYALYPHMTVAENIGYAWKVADVPSRTHGANCRDSEVGGPVRFPGPQARVIVWRPVPARRHGPCHHPLAQSVPLRRAAVEP